jgi:hypothetical protein
MAQLYPRALGSLYVASYNSQGYGGLYTEREREKKVGGGSERHYRLEGGVTET